MWPGILYFSAQSYDREHHQQKRAREATPERQNCMQADRERHELLAQEIDSGQRIEPMSCRVPRLFCPSVCFSARCKTSTAKAQAAILQVTLNNWLDDICDKHGEIC